MVRAFADRDHLDHHRGVGIDDGDDIGRPVTHIHGLTISARVKCVAAGLSMVVALSSVTRLSVVTELPLKSTVHIFSAVTVTSGRRQRRWTAHR